MSSPVRAEGYDSSAQQREDSRTAARRPRGTGLGLGPHESIGSSESPPVHSGRLAAAHGARTRALPGAGLRLRLQRYTIFKIVG